MYRVEWAVLTLAAALVLPGCASSGDSGYPRGQGIQKPAVQSGTPAASLNTGDGLCEAGLSNALRLRISLVREMMHKGLLLAALAHLDGLDPADGRTPVVRYLRAEAFRKLGNTARAEDLYRGLVNTCLSGLGYHGLGLIAAQRGDLNSARAELERARRLRPTDPRVRNDLGYVLLLTGRYPSARTEFLTAMELGDPGRRSAMNYILLLFREGQAAEAERVGTSMGIPEAELARMQARAEKLGPDGPGRGQAAPGHTAVPDGQPG